MPGFHLTEKAIADLKDIARYTQARWGRAQRIEYLKRLDLTFARLVDDPRLGINYDRVRHGYRGYLESRHIIFFRRKGVDVEIIRILHQSMDIETRLDER